MTHVKSIRETMKIPTRSTRIKLSGTNLEISRERDGVYSYQTLDLSKFDMYLRGVDTEGFLFFEVLPRSAVNPTDVDERDERTVKSDEKKSVSFDPERKRIQGDVEIPTNYLIYLERASSQGSIYRVFVNERKRFLLKVHTKDGSRLHNLGELSSPNSYLNKFAKLLEKNQKWLTKPQIKDILHENRMYDGQKMSISLEILDLEGYIKKRDGSYASLNIEEEKGTAKPKPSDRNEKEPLESMNV